MSNSCVRFVFSLASMVCLMVPLGCASSEKPCSDPLSQLKSGNERFVSGHATHPHESAALRRDLDAQGQHPFATVIACSDSRVPVELLFDQGIGDIFVIRVAGNIVAEDETGSIEYAVEHLECPLVVVLGHKHCGAVTAAVEHVEDTPSIMALVHHIEPAVEHVLKRDPSLKGEELIAAAVKENVWHGVEDLVHRSEITRERIADGSLTVVGAVYDIASGEVHWLGHHPDEDRLAAH